MRNVLVTGGSRGIGKAIKDKFANAGYNVYAPSREELDLSDLQSITQFIEKNHMAEITPLLSALGICGPIVLPQSKITFRRRECFGEREYGKNYWIVVIILLKM
jgi:NAD(P)-dependent dehydrogenase (short-subunit alcohol dehydrogenase family)